METPWISREQREPQTGRAPPVSPDTIATLAAAAVIIGFLWSLHRDVAGLHRDMSDLRERMARLEGAVDVLTKFLVDRERAREPTP